MSNKVNKDINVEGIDCNKCLTNIKREINNIKGVDASINYNQKSLNLHVNKIKDLDNVLLKVKSIANKHEHQIIVKEKVVEKTFKKTMIVENLDCANCAAKMERQISKISNVKNATIDYMTKKLTIETEEKKELENIIDQAKSIVCKIEADVRLVDEITYKEENEETKHEENYKKAFLTLGIGGLIFALGLIVKLPIWQELIIFLISYFIVGGEVLLRAVKNILKGQIFDENLLMTIATIGAFLIKEFPEGVAVMLFYQVGELFQDIAVDRSRKSISKLMDIRPDYANLKFADGLKKVSPDEVEIGDFIVVKPGEKIPLDGKVVEGSSFVDTTALTGESVLREIEVGSDVLSGFINQNGVLTIEVTKNFGESAVSVILDLVENASSKKAATENFITKFAKYYTPVVVIAAAIIAFIPPLFFNELLSDWGKRALVFLVISCPCALVISIPLGFFGGIGGASRRGILVKGSNYLEALNSVDTVVFDKTGTLTKGVFNVTKINSEENYTTDEIIRYAAYAESYSNHPIAKSILKYYNKEIDNQQISKYEEISGKGIKILFEDKEILVGNSKLMVNANVDYKKDESIGTIVYISINNEYAGNIIISDEIKDDSLQAIKDLKSLGIKKTVMLTGDSKQVGEMVGNKLGIDEIYSELLPNEKVEKLEYIYSSKSTKGKLIFVGDGINDAPVLARADIGIAMGGLGSDAAIEAADVVIMTDEPSKISTAINIAKKTRKIVWQNIYFSIGVKIFFLLLGAIGIASMWEAVFADVGVSVIAILNAMRVMKIKNMKKNMKKNMEKNVAKNI